MSVKYSFIIPVLNEEKLIKKCLSSIISQTLNDFEIIVVDNGCTDNTVKNASEFNCRIIKEENKGISLARNSGANRARGKFLCFIDADGVLDKFWLENAEKTLSNKKIDAVTGLNIFMDRNLWQFLIFNIYTFFAYIFVSVMNLFNKSFLAGNNFVIKKEVFDSIGQFDHVIGEDVWLTKKFIKNKYKSKFNYQMKVFYSSRGFKSVGFIQTIFYWIKNTIVKTPAKNYTYKNKD